MAKQVFNKSKFDINEWLVAASIGYTPGGTYIDETIWVATGEERCIFYSGGQVFGGGSRPYSLTSYFSGKEPQFVSGAEGEHTKFISKYAAIVRFVAPSIILVVKGAQNTTRTLYICASEEQIAQAKRMIKLTRTMASAGGSITPLVALIVESWTHYEEWSRRYIRNGVCYDSDGSPDSRYIPDAIQDVLKFGSDSHHYYDCIRYLNEVQLKALHYALYHLDDDQRTAIFAEAEAGYIAAQKAIRKQFAIEQARCLKSLGLSKNEAWRLIKATGAAQAVDCAKWLFEDLGISESGIVKDKLEKAARQCLKAKKARYISNVFESHGLVVPPGRLTQMLKHLRGAQALGYISQELKI